MKSPRDTLSLSTLIAANLVPVAGALLFDWDAGIILLLYWTENLVVGFYNVLKMALLRVERPTFHLGKLFMIPFFCVHFGGFCAVHGFFLMALFKVGGGTDPFMSGGAWFGPLIFLQMLFSVVRNLWQSAPEGMLWAVLALFASHGVSFVRNYILGGEYTSLSMQKVMMGPYGRIVLLHVAIIAGAAPVMILGSPIPLLIILVLLKVGIDIWLHIKSHRALPQRSVKG
jgi:hypothetical protein